MYGIYHKMETNPLFSFHPTNAEEKYSNMVVLETALPTGFTSSTDNLYNLAQLENVKKIETQNGDSVIIIYFDHLKTDAITCLTFDGYRVHKVAEQKPVPIVAYDYYDSCKCFNYFLNYISSIGG